MSQKLQDISASIEALTLLETSELVKMLEERLGVSAAAPQMMMAAAMPAAGAGAAAEEEKTEFDVVLVSGGSEKVKIIKEIRAITGLPLKEAKDASEGANVVLKTGVSKAEAQKMKEQLVAAGATVDLV
jgi:large subunit ribosomal protein L7/L12